jgi:ketosteroid isomerase-like protein
MSALTPEFARQFAEEWVAAWNAHDLERILSHYEDDFEMASPVILQLAGEPSGRLHGKAAVGAYWARALAAFPNLHFELQDVLAGIGSITIYYHGHRGRVAEIFRFSSSGKVAQASAHYAIPDR